MLNGVIMSSLTYRSCQLSATPFILLPFPAFSPLPHITTHVGTFGLGRSTAVLPFVDVVVRLEMQDV